MLRDPRWSFASDVLSPSDMERSAIKGLRTQPARCVGFQDRYPWLLPLPLRWWLFYRLSTRLQKPKYLGSFVLYSVSFCIIEGPETLQDFVQMQLQEIQDNIRSRRNKIFLLMEEVISDLKASTILELKLGLGGTSYEDFIRNMHLPLQLRSFIEPIHDITHDISYRYILCVGLIEKPYIVFLGPGYLVCARCSASGVFLSIESISIPDGCSGPLQPPTTQRCTNCSGTGKVYCYPFAWFFKQVVEYQPIHLVIFLPLMELYLLQVMCPTCLCTGMAMASEHDPRIDPFD
ncbi:hypothetical protein BHM03_00030034 [Ensete ventricosum]|uniref:Uncharacterized protein n=1 Tax=Ensete ventricosum TaxID=4639 RepID=A0A445MI45_ENSVE|nr:hypothetical protein BHM03_00030034 [Ensete ventricosum]